MKHIARFTGAIFALFLTFSMTASAQQNNYALLGQIGEITANVPSHALATVDPAVADYVRDPYKTRSAAWWNTLQEEISLEDKSYRAVESADLQNIIFFQANHAGKIDLRASTSTLQDVLFYHKSEAMRIMAMTALYEIGEPSSMDQVEKRLYQLTSERVRDFSVKAVQAYRNNR